MADQYVVAAGGNWSAAATWESSPGAADATGPPAAADVCQNVLNAALVIDANTEPVASYTQTGTGSCAFNAQLTATGAVSLAGTGTGTGDIDCGNFDVSVNTNMSGYNGDISSAGDISMGGGTTTFGSSATLTADAAAGARTLTCNAIKLPAFTVANNGVTSFTAADKTICQSFLIQTTGSKFTGHANGIDCYGSFVRDAGTFTPGSTATLTLKAGSGNAGNLKVYADSPCYLAVESGFTATLTGNSYFTKVACAGTINTTTTEYLYMQAAENWWVGSTGTVNCDVLVLNVSNAPGADVTLTNHTLTLRASSADKSIAFANNINLGTGDFNVSGVGAGKDMACVMTATKSLVCRDILLGDPAATTGSGQLTLPKTVTCRNIGSANAANTANALIVPAGANVTVTGTVDGSNDGNAITFTIAGSHQFHGGTYQSVTPSAQMDCSNGGVQGDAANNALVILQATNAGEYPPPGSLMMMGVGR